MQGHHAGRSGTFTVNGDYVKVQARAAMNTFVAPLSGIYAAAKGGSFVTVRDAKSGSYTEQGPKKRK
jgi:hypothetical protein